MAPRLVDALVPFNKNHTTQIELEGSYVLSIGVNTKEEAKDKVKEEAKEKKEKGKGKQDYKAEKIRTQWGKDKEEGKRQEIVVGRATQKLVFEELDYEVLIALDLLEEFMKQPRSPKQVERYELISRLDRAMRYMAKAMISDAAHPTIRPRMNLNAPSLEAQDPEILQRILEDYRVRTEDQSTLAHTGYNKVEPWLVLLAQWTFRWSMPATGLLLIES